MIVSDRGNLHELGIRDAGFFILRHECKMGRVSGMYTFDNSHRAFLCKLQRVSVRRYTSNVIIYKQFKLKEGYVDKVCIFVN